MTSDAGDSGLAKAGPSNGVDSANVSTSDWTEHYWASLKDTDWKVINHSQELEYLATAIAGKAAGLRGGSVTQGKLGHAQWSGKVDGISLQFGLSASDVPFAVQTRSACSRELNLWLDVPATRPQREQRAGSWSPVAEGLTSNSAAEFAQLPKSTQSLIVSTMHDLQLASFQLSRGELLVRSVRGLGEMSSVVADCATIIDFVVAVTPQL